MSSAHEIYETQLYSSRGLPIYDPQPEWEDYPRVRKPPVAIGDVGYMQRGGFKRVFNIHLGPEDPEQGQDLPERFEPLELKSSNITYTTFGTETFCSRSVSSKSVSLELDTIATVIGGEVSFSSKKERGAALITPDRIRSRDVLNHRDYEKYRNTNIDSWYRLLQSLGRAVRYEDIFLVVGVDLTKSWSTAVFVDTQLATGFKVTFTYAPIGTFRLATGFRWHDAQGVLTNWGPAPEDAEVSCSADSLDQSPPARTILYGPSRTLAISVPSSSGAFEIAQLPTPSSPALSGALTPINVKDNQTVFIRRIFGKKRRRFLGIRLRANGEPQDDDMDHSGDDSSAPVRVEGSPSSHDDPLVPVLDYILENSDADSAIVCDADFDLYQRVISDVDSSRYSTITWGTVEDGHDSSRIAKIEYTPIPSRLDTFPYSTQLSLPEKPSTSLTDPGRSPELGPEEQSSRKERPGGTTTVDVLLRPSRPSRRNIPPSASQLALEDTRPEASWQSTEEEQFASEAAPMSEFESDDEPSEDLPAPPASSPTPLPDSLPASSLASLLLPLDSPPSTPLADLLFPDSAVSVEAGSKADGATPLTPLPAASRTARAPYLTPSSKPHTSDTPSSSRTPRDSGGAQQQYQPRTKLGPQAGQDDTGPGVRYGRPYDGNF